MNNIDEIKNKFKSSRELRDKISRNHQWHFYKDENNNENDEEEEKDEEEEEEEDFDAYYDDIGSLYGDVF